MVANNGPKTTQVHELQTLFERLREALVGVEPTLTLVVLLDSFQAQLQEIRTDWSQRLGELELTQRRELAEAVERFTSLYTAQMEYHLQPWAPEIARSMADGSLEEVAARGIALSELESLLLEHEHLRQVRPRNRSEKKELDEQQDLVSERIAAVYSRLMEGQGESSENRAQQPSTEEVSEGAASLVPSDTANCKGHDGQRPAEESEPLTEVSVVLNPPHAAHAPNPEPIEPVISLPSTSPEPVSADATEGWCDIERGVWERVAESDFATAYWLSFGLPDGSVPSWILKACFLAERVTADDYAVTEAYSNLLFSHWKSADGLSEGAHSLTAEEIDLLVTMATLRPALLAPDSGAGGWLYAFQVHDPDLAIILQAASDMAARRVSLDPTEVMDQGERMMRVQEVVLGAQEWLTAQQSSNLKYAPATAAIRKLASTDTNVGMAIHIVANDLRSRVSEVRQVLSVDLATTQAMEDLIDRLVRENGMLPGTKLLTARQETLIHRLVQARDLLRPWVTVVEQVAESDRDSRQAEVSRFYDRFRLASNRLRQRDSATELAGTLRLLVLRLLEEIETGFPGKKGASLDRRSWQSQLRLPLLLLSNVPFVLRDELPESISALNAREILERTRAGTSLIEAAHLHINSGDFAAAQLAIDELTDEFQRVKLMRDYKQALEASRNQFTEELEALKGELEQAVFDQLLSDAERTTIESRLVACELRQQEGFSRFGVLREELQSVRTALADQRDRATRDTSAVIQRLLARARAEGSVQAEAYAQNALVRLEEGAPELSEELMSLAEQALSSGVASVQSEEISANRHFEAFQETLPKLLEWLKQLPKRKELYERLAYMESVPGLLSVDRVKGTTAKRTMELAVEAFDRLAKDQRLRNPAEEEFISPALKIVLQFLGFSRPELRKRTLNPEWWHYRANMSDQKSCPLPHFGSARNGSYDVLICWNRASVETVGAIIQAQNLGENSPIVIYPGMLTLGQREQWSQWCHKHQIAVLLLDEALYLYLTTVPDKRLTAWAACSMPWGWANPYTPFGAGNVAPEMFHGRTELINSLKDPNGTSVIYGGRQFGKSATLRALERETHDPERNKRVLFMDIRTLGTAEGQHKVDGIWEMLRDSVRRMDPKSRATVSTVRNDLLRWASEPDARVWILLDEADEFLKADAATGFSQVHKLRHVVEDSGRRVRIVFSGLHNVARYHGLPNHPFASFAPATKIGPLSPPEGYSLIVEPMELLGFRFESPNVVYRILAYTNYHPALIQLFCYYLVKTRLTTRPPYTITMQMVADAYRSPEVRRAMRERFEWTVALDWKYRLLIYSVVLQQSEHGYRDEFTAPIALAWAQEQVPEKAAQLSIEEVRALLDELVDLNVLIKLEAGSFRIRNANVVRALGSPFEIREKLEDLKREPLLVEFEPRKLHASFGQPADQWSPLTLEQESAIRSSPVGVHLIFGSSALGMEELEPALRRLVSPGTESTQTDQFLVIPQHLTSVESIRAFLDENLPETGHHLFLMSGSTLLDFMDKPGQKLADLVRLIMVRRSHIMQRLTNVIVTLTPEEAVRWWSLPSDVREEERATHIFALTPWDRTMVQHFLQRRDVPCDTQTLEEFMNVTGGWSWLVRHQILVDEREHRSLSQSLSLLRRELEMPGGSAVQEFLRHAGLDVIPFALPILRFVATLEPVLLEDITPAMLEIDVSSSALTTSTKALCTLGILRTSGSDLTCDPVIRRVLQL